jgi:protein bicaudal C
MGLKMLGTNHQALQATVQKNVDLSPKCCCLQSQIQVHMTMEISPQHHSIVLGKNSNNLKQIMQRTSTEIMFPDAGDPNIPNLKKSSICITGTINNVYLARQQLMVCC